MLPSRDRQGVGYRAPRVVVPSGFDGRSTQRLTLPRKPDLQTTRNRLGFIGLGHLGSRIARRLVAAGFSMIVYDRDPAKVAELVADGASPAEDLAQLARDADVVLSCLPDADAVEDVYVGSAKVLGSAKAGALFIELSTVAPETSRQLYQAARELGIHVLDVAVSGSTPAAEAGTLTLFGGGERECFEAARPIFAAVARHWFYMGPSGSGVAMKLVVNTLLGLGMQAVAEGVALGSRLGLQRDLLLDALAKTAVVPPALVGKLLAAKRNDYAAQFPLRLMRKDFGLILEAAARSDFWMPATQAAAAVNSAEAASGREEDFSAIIRRMEHSSGTSVTI